jgi:hypothetical protein
VEKDMRKQYDQKLSDENDPRGREAAIQHFKTWGIEVTHNPDIYDVDLMLDNGIALEVEMRRKWRGPKFPYRTVHFLKRKEKYLDRKMIMMFISDDLEYAMLLREYHIKDCPEKKVYTSENPDEIVLDVPLNRATIIKLRKMEN